MGVTSSKPDVVRTARLSRCFRIVSASAFGSAVALLCLAGVRPAWCETLDEALMEAYMTNPQILAERAKLRATDENVPQALGGYRPTITLSGSDGYEHVGQTQTPPQPFSNTNTYSDHPKQLNATLTQPLYQGGVAAKVATAEDSVSAERAADIAVEGTVFSSIAQVYYDVLRDTALVKIDGDYQQSLQLLLTATRGTYEIGALTAVDVAQIEGRLASVTAQQLLDQGIAEQDRANYERFVGHPPGPLTEPTLKPTVPAKLDTVIELATKNNPNVIAAIFAERQANDTVAATEGQLLPNLALVLQRQETIGQTAPSVGLTTNSTQALLQLTIPFYAQGVVWSQSRAAIDQAGQARSQADDARRQGVQAAKSAWQTIQAGRVAIAAFTNALQADLRATEGITQQQKAGQATITDVLTQEQQEFSDEAALARTQHDVHVAEFSLAMQIGRLTAADLHLGVQTYDVTQHYNAVRDKWLGLGDSH